MQISREVPLSEYTTMHLGGKANAVITVSSKDELKEAVDYAKANGLRWFVMGGGSNIIVHDEGFDGVIILSRITGFEVLEQNEDGATLRIGAGENWDEVVKKTVDMSLSGIEAMSLIPGTAGATPVQNVGAYGQEIADTLTELEAYDVNNGNFVTLKNHDCGFSYRNSIFKDPSNRRYIIVSITLKLSKQTLKPPFYASLQQYFEQQAVDLNSLTPADIRAAVIAIRQHKLPDPKIIANTGSFFKNPIIPASQYEEIVKSFPAIPNFPAGEGLVKVPAGWLIEQAGMKGYSNHGFATHSENALVVTNVSSHSYDDLVAFMNEIRKAVKDKFGISLEQEPETL